MEKNLQPSKESVSEYYNEFWKSFSSKPNSRQRTIYKFLLKAGLKSNSTVLEVGCGNGVLSKLIAQKVTGGLITGVDISEETIGMLGKKYSANKNMKFKVSDMSAWSGNEKFDFLVLPDVIEHIPVEHHDNLFKVLRSIAHDNTVIVINIPDPHALEWTHKHRPDLLQIIDQPIHTNFLLSNVYANGFYIEFLKSYSLYFKPFDYQVMFLKVRKENHELRQLSKQELILSEIKSRITFWR